MVAEDLLACVCCESEVLCAGHSRPVRLAPHAVKPEEHEHWPVGATPGLRICSAWWNHCRWEISLASGHSREI